MNTSMPTPLVALGDALERAARADLEARSHMRAPRRWRSRRLAVVLVALVVVIPGGALAATNLLSDDQVAASLPAGTLALGGTEPACTAVVADVEYHCTLAKAPSEVDAPESARPPTSARAVKRALPAKHRIVEVRVGDMTVVAEHGKLIHRPAQIEASTTPGPPPSTSPDWLGTDEATVDASKHVNGGCRALNAAGTDWECYIGEAAVRQKIISQGFLGQYAPSPGVG